MERVIFLVGDAGDVTFDSSPLLQRLTLEIEAWSARLRRDSSAVVIFLGDNVYPEGIREASDPFFPQDSARLDAQVRTLSGMHARRFRSLGIFIPGNHDWGNMRGAPGVQRLRNEAAFLDRFRSRGIHVRLLPEAGTAGPATVDLGTRLRMLFIDTAWWLFNYTNPQKSTMVIATDAALRATQDRDVMIFAHHPFRSGGSHGGLVPFWETIGVRYLLARSGTLLQDLNSIPYQQLHDELEGVFQRTTTPLVFVGGHDHSLQVIRRPYERDPRWMLASGSGSKLTDVGDTQGQLFRRSAPGYMKIFLLRDGRLALFVEAAADQFLKCEQIDGSSRQRCVSEGLADFETVYSTYLK